MPTKNKIKVTEEQAMKEYDNNLKEKNKDMVTKDNGGTNFCGNCKYYWHHPYWHCIRIVIGFTTLYSIPIAILGCYFPKLFSIILIIASILWVILVVFGMINYIFGTSETGPRCTNPIITAKHHSNEIWLMENQNDDCKGWILNPKYKE